MGLCVQMHACVSFHGTKLCVYMNIFVYRYVHVNLCMHREHVYLGQTKYSSMIFEVQLLYKTTKGNQKFPTVSKLQAQQDHHKHPCTPILTQ